VTVVASREAGEMPSDYWKWIFGERKGYRALEGWNEILNKIAVVVADSAGEMIKLKA
jgi:hypothetical protein